MVVSSHHGPRSAKAADTELFEFARTDFETIMEKYPILKTRLAQIGQVSLIHPLTENPPLFFLKTRIVAIGQFCFTERYPILRTRLAQISQVCATEKCPILILETRLAQIGHVCF